MRCLITGTTTGIGKAIIDNNKEIQFVSVNRNELDLEDINAVKEFQIPSVEGAILNAGNDKGGGVLFTEHAIDDVVDVINCNLVANVVLAHKILNVNPTAKILFVTSTNINKQYPKNLAYNIGKLGVKNLIDLIKIDYPDADLKEARVALTKTSFNVNRHKPNHKPLNDLYDQKHMTAEYVAKEILDLYVSGQHYREINTNA
jgi:NADP-dependent 3-hydroxy acid dehydrogenase YdfG